MTSVNKRRCRSSFWKKRRRLNARATKRCGLITAVDYSGARSGIFAPTLCLWTGVDRDNCVKIDSENWQLRSRDGHVTWSASHWSLTVGLILSRLIDKFDLKMLRYFWKCHCLDSKVQADAVVVALSERRVALTTEWSKIRIGFDCNLHTIYPRRSNILILERKNKSGGRWIKKGARRGGVKNSIFYLVFFFFFEWHQQWMNSRRIWKSTLVNRVRDSSEIHAPRAVQKGRWHDFPHAARTEGHQRARHRRWACVRLADFHEEMAVRSDFSLKKCLTVEWDVVPVFLKRNSCPIYRPFEKNWIFF